MTVTVFMFRADDGRTREERLFLAACLAGYGDPPGEGTVFGVPADGIGAAVPESWRIARTERGKPYFPDRRDLHFSISHSRDLWACAFSGRPVGLDVQAHVKKRGEGDGEAAARLGRMAERFFHPEEAAWVREDPFERFFRIWAAKESYVKYTGEGIGAGFGRFCVMPGRRQEMPGLQGPAAWEAEGASFFGRRILNGEAGNGLQKVFGKEGQGLFYTLCVCFEGTEGPVQIMCSDKISDNLMFK